MTEVRQGLIEFGKALNDSVTVPGLGELPGGQVSLGRAVRGARARLIRSGRVVAENLRLGIMVRKKFFSSDVEPVTEAGFLKDVFVATGRRDLGHGDALELYADDTIGPDTTRRDGLAQVLAPAYDQLTGFHVQVRLQNGGLRDGALVGLLRGGQVAGDPMRVLGVFGPSGRAEELPAGQVGMVLLGFQCAVPPLAGDALVAYAEPAREFLETREGFAVVHGVTDAGGTLVAAVEVPEGQSRTRISTGSLARLLRPGGTTFNERATVVARDIPVVSVAQGPVLIGASAGAGVFTVGLAARDVRQNDRIETYVPAGGLSAPAPVPAPPPKTVPPDPGAAKGLAPPHAPTAPLVDVNKATPPELSRLPGLTPERVEKTLELRRQIGGFADVEDFGVALGLQPHEIVRLRGKATASRPEQRGTGVRQLDI